MAVRAECEQQHKGQTLHLELRKKGEARVGRGIFKQSEAISGMSSYSFISKPMLDESWHATACSFHLLPVP